jgi:Spy/CpxP family protein refolding chaperone
MALALRQRSESIGTRTLRDKEEMMKANMLLGAFAVVVSLIWGVAPASADPDPHMLRPYSGQHGGCPHTMDHHGPAADHLHHLLRHQKEIGLTEEQVRKLRAIDLEFDRGRIKLEAEIHVTERELMALLEEEKTDLSAIEAKVKQSANLEAALRMLAFGARRDALAVLTPEQREKAKAAHEKMIKDRMSQHRGCSSVGSSWGRDESTESAQIR